MKTHSFESLTHPFDPLYSPDSRVLILGSFPSAASRQGMFYYGHPRNRFWPLIAGLFSSPVPTTVPEKKALILDNRLALWDTVRKCDIILSADSTIRKAEPNDIPALLSEAPIRAVFCNGREALKTYDRYILPATSFPAFPLPSTSPANAAWSLERLTGAWKEILRYL